MLKKNGAEELREDAQKEFPQTLTKVNERVYHAFSFGHSNAIIIIAANSVILIDTLESEASGELLKAEIEKLTDKPVKTIIYTHGHPDHWGGSGVFAPTVQEVIAFAPKNKPLKHTDMINPVLFQRAAKQFGYTLSDEELITQGLGIREKRGDKMPQVLQPTTIYEDWEVKREIDGVKIKMVAAPGETDDQIFVWLEDDQVLCCGDNYYACWPNLYAIRGGQYRDVAAWVESLQKMSEYPAKALLPGHTKAILGEENVKEVLANYAGALESVLLQTLECINKGLSVSEAVEAVKLPEKYANLSYLREFYGSIDWSVRGIYQGYVGWFDGNPTNLHPLSDKEYAAHLIPLLGGAEKVQEIMAEAVQSEDYKQWQWALQLCDLLLEENESRALKEKKAEILLKMAPLETSANGRHFYQTVAKELLK